MVPPAVEAAQPEELTGGASATTLQAAMDAAPSASAKRDFWLLQALICVIGLILASPVLLLLAIAVKVSDGGPVFYRGERVGRNRRTFGLYKFRTLKVGAEKGIGARLLTESDRRVYFTRIGRFLKRSKLDELPQLLNVIRGDMRLVGPRPIRPIFLQQALRDIPDYAERFEIPPGITGIAQLRGGYYTTPREKLKYDLVYLKNRSLLLDLKVILLTFVKILNRVLSGGAVVLFLFLFLSFLPPTWLTSLYVSPFGIRVGLIYVFLLVPAAAVLMRVATKEFSLYRSPLNVPMLLFFVPCLVSAFFSDEPAATLRRAGYYAVTGFLVSFLIVNSLGTRRFTTAAVRVIALTSVLISGVGLLQVAMISHAVNAGLTDDLPAYVRIFSTLGNPVTLATYLVLGLPLVLAEAAMSKSGAQRDFWIVCATIAFVGILMTQTRVGLVALLVTGAVFFSRRLSQALPFVVAFVLLIVLLVLQGPSRFSVATVRGEVSRWMQTNGPVLEDVPEKVWLFGGGRPQILIREKADRHTSAGKPDPEDTMIPNMHVTLMLEHGVAAWLVMMGLIFSALRAMKQAHDRTRDERFRSILWAIISSIVGFLVSMNGMNAFHYLTLQVFFWSLIGIGTGIVIHLNGGERQNLIWRFGDAGD